MLIRAAEQYAIRHWADADPMSFADATEPLQDLDAIAGDLPHVLKERQRLDLTLRCLRSAAEIESEKARMLQYIWPSGQVNKINGLFWPSWLACRWVKINQPEKRK